MDLYGFDGEQAVQLLDEPTLGDRSRLSLLENGTIYFLGSGSATQTVEAYYRVDGCALLETEATDALAAGNSAISWQLLKVGSAQAADRFSSEKILADIQEVLEIPDQEYEADPEAYDLKYSHLGNGLVWSLRHRNSGVYTLCIWNAAFDIDGDGQEELCVGRSVDAVSAYPIAIYWQNGEVVCDDRLNDYVMPYDGVLPVEWHYLGG